MNTTAYFSYLKECPKCSVLFCIGKELVKDGYKGRADGHRVPPGTTNISIFFSDYYRMSEYGGHFYSEQNHVCDSNEEIDEYPSDREDDDRYWLKTQNDQMQRSNANTAVAADHSEDIDYDNYWSFDNSYWSTPHSRNRQNDDSEDKSQAIPPEAGEVPPAVGEPPATSTPITQKTEKSGTASATRSQKRELMMALIGHRAPLKRLVKRDRKVK